MSRFRMKATFSPSSQPFTRKIMSDKKLVVHLIANAHLDPVWLWNWPAGVDETIATFRSAADRCDEYPQFIYTRGEAWLFEVIEDLDPILFERIKKLVASGRWAIAGGQYVQPDANLPTEAGWRKQFEIGGDYFENRFGIRPRFAPPIVGYRQRRRVRCGDCHARCLQCEPFRRLLAVDVAPRPADGLGGRLRTEAQLRHGVRRSRRPHLRVHPAVGSLDQTFWDGRCRGTFGEAADLF